VGAADLARRTDEKGEVEPGRQLRQLSDSWEQHVHGG
jgi:hypothetical protein